MTAWIDIEREGELLSVEVLGRVHSGALGGRDRHGLLVECDEELEIELLEVGKDADGRPYVLTASEEREALEALAEEAEKECPWA